MKVAIIRLIVLVFVLLNQALVAFGVNPLPFSEEMIYEGVSSIATIAAGIWAWWKDNPVSKQAKENDAYLRKQGLK
ncbi:MULTISPECIES: phage holin [Gracilibacillus]|uniref:phage holin n=1 Tax=Gracilibacillus TaxID=74385 RepID=UPI00082596A9|nr:MULTISPECIES: phage holin [Gracilibacillus]